MNSKFSLCLGAVLLLGCMGCDENTDVPINSTPDFVSDAELHHIVTTSAKAAYFKNSSDTIAGNSGAAHAGKILVWYNAKAKEQFDTQGKIKTSPSFADSSLIVKEIFNSGGARLYYAIMFKLSAASNKGAGNWVWAELLSNGQPYISAENKGAGCSGCHSLGIDYTRMNDSHP